MYFALQEGSNTMNINKLIQDGQDTKVVEKIQSKIIDMLTVGEFIQYIALQKKPAVTLLPDSITVSNKRIFLGEFTKLGLTTNFEIFRWEEIKDIAFKEEIFGSKVTVIPFTGENLTIDYIPKVQARKLYQLIKTALEDPEAIAREEPSITSPEPRPIEVVDFEQDSVDSTKVENNVENSTIDPLDDELTKKLTKLKSLYDRQLISQAEYESKKAELLTQL